MTGEASVPAPKRASVALGWRIYGVGVMALAMVCLAWGDFDPGQPVPKGFPGRVALAYFAAALMLCAGAAVQWRRTASWGAAALFIYYTLVVVVLMNGRLMLAHYGEYGFYSGAAEQLAIAAGALLVYAGSAGIDPTSAAPLARLSTRAFGVCALLFGGAHFVYTKLTVPLVPKWLPPSQEFWAYATGVAQVAAGLAILTGIKDRLAAVLLTAMYVSFTVLVHAPMLLAGASSRVIWSENALNLALIGTAWVVAESLGLRRQKGIPPR
jgi:uncharacterized membrane protein YphA (DoxX/SURF4 family)